jgi:hypothetical protein
MDCLRVNSARTLLRVLELSGSPVSAVMVDISGECNTYVCLALPNCSNALTPIWLLRGILCQPPIDITRPVKQTLR